MRFDDPLLRGTLIRRYKRFLSDHRLDDGTIAAAHCANSGSMLGLDQPGSEVWLSRARNPARKLAFTWELVRANGGLVGVNTMHPNRIVEAAVRDGRIAELAGYGSIRREVRYGRNSRIDLLLEGPGRPKCYVEVKNVHLKRAEAAEFPDAVTRRGTKHLRELADMVEGGARGVVLYLVQREDCDRFELAADIDPAYASASRAARSHGVEAFCYCCKLSAEAIELDRPLPIAA